MDIMAITAKSSTSVKPARLRDLQMLPITNSFPQFINIMPF